MSTLLVSTALLLTFGGVAVSLLLLTAAGVGRVARYFCEAVPGASVTRLEVERGGASRATNPRVASGDEGQPPPSDLTAA